MNRILKMIAQAFVVVGAIVGFYSSIHTKADPQPTLTDLPAGVLDIVLDQLSLQDTFSVALVSKKLSAGVRAIRTQQLKVREKNRVEIYSQFPVFAKFDQQFVKIPKGLLPPDPEADGAQVEVQAFESSQYQVTRALWIEFVEDIPVHVPQAERDAWKECLDCPTNYVAYEENKQAAYAKAEVQLFIERLNQETQALGCTYRLPTDAELWYKKRADVTGLNQDPYSAGVTTENVDLYITHLGNSDPENMGQAQVQSVFLKLLNRFGVGSGGNVWELSSDPYDVGKPEYGRAIRGGAFNADVSGAETATRTFFYAGSREASVGFSLVRSCR